MVANIFLKNVVHDRVRAMGALSQKAAGSNMLDAPAQAQPSGLSGLSSFFDFDGDGSIVDELLGIAAKKFFWAYACGFRLNVHNSHLEI